MMFDKAMKLITSHNNALMEAFPDFGPQTKLTAPKRISNKRGYMVSFQRIEGRMLVGDYFPNKHAGENLISTREQAWEYCQAFAKATVGLTCDLYVIGSNFSPLYADGSYAGAKHSDKISNR